MKKKLFARLLALLLVTVSLGSVLPVTASAAGKKPIRYECAIFPAKTMNIKQIAYESASHSNCNAIDFVSSQRIVAPFTGTVVFKDPAWGYVVFQSNSKVRYADGTIDYMTVCFMHDNNISDIRVGRTYRQGTPFYDQGGFGEGRVMYGYHVDMSIYRGRVCPRNNYGRGTVYAYQALFIDPDFTTTFSGRGKGYMKPGNYMSHGAPANWLNLWNTLDYSDECTKYRSVVTLKISKKTTVKTLPCSAKTDRDSKNVITLKKGTTVKTICLVKNLEGNYWYLVLVGNKVGYVYAGDTICTKNCRGESIWLDKQNYYANGNVLWRGGKRFTETY